MTTATVTRKTKETDISIKLVPVPGTSEIHTGIGFFDHMLTAFAFHSGITLNCQVIGDLHVDGHHTVEDTGLALGQAVKEALEDKLGIERFASAYIPMDEALGFAALDISGRPFLRFDREMTGMIGDYDACLTKEFFRALTTAAGLTLHLKAEGENAHHMTEALYKAAGRAFRQAAEITGSGIPSTKGAL